MTVPPVSSDPCLLAAPAVARPTTGRARGGLARLAALALAMSVAGTACGGRSNDTVSPDVDLAQAATGQGGGPLPADQTGSADPAAVRADLGGAAVPAAGLGGVEAAPPTATPAAPVAAAPAPSSTTAPAVPVPAAAAPVAATPTAVVAPAPDPAAGPAPTDGSPGAPEPAIAVSGAGSPAPTPTPTTAAAPVTAPEADLVAGEERSFTLLNELRGGMSLAAMTRDPGLDALAREWSRHMSEVGELAHSENPYGENIAFTSNTSLTATEAAQVFERLWSEDPGHSQNMAGAYVKVGVGVWKSERGWYGTHLYNY